MGGDAAAQALDPNLFLTANPQNLMSYSPFTSMDGTWPTAYDPALMTAFGFAGAGMMSGQGLNPAAFYFPGTAGADLTAGIWGQENTGAAAATANPLMLSSFMMNHLSMADQQPQQQPQQQQQQQQPQQQLPNSEMITLDGNIAAVNTIDPMIGLGQTFSGMAVNGGVATVPLEQTAASTLASTPGAPGGVEGPPQTVSPATSQQNSAPQPEKPKSWAAIASQPAKPRPPPPPKTQPQPEPSNDIPSSGSRRPGGGGRGGGGNSGPQSSRGGGSSISGKGPGSRRTQPIPTSQASSVPVSSGSGVGGGNTKPSKSSSQSELVGKLKLEKNPTEMSINMMNARFFVIKSYAEDDIHRSIKYNIWTSTEHGNRRLDQAFREQKGKGSVYLLFSVNGSGHFCGVAEMMSEVDFTTMTGVWAQDKWKGSFEVKWIYVKDVPNSQLRHIRLENNENKPVTNSRDTQEVPLAKAKQVIKIVHSYQHKTSIFDDFDHYEKKQEEDKKVRHVLQAVFLLIHSCPWVKVQRSIKSASKF